MDFSIVKEWIAGNTAGMVALETLLTSHPALAPESGGQGELEKVLALETWFKEQGIPLYAVNSNPTQKKWTKSPKIHADVYIDDGALGVPLIRSMTTSRPYVDWVKVREWLVEEGFL